MHNNIMAAGSRDRPPMLATGRYAQWQSRFLRYIDTQEPNDNSPEVPEQTTVETVLNMSPTNKAHFESEKEAIHLMLTGIGDEIYLTVDACKTTHEMWEAIERLQQGESLNIQDVKTNLFWEFGKFTSHDGETIKSYYTRFYKLMNEMIRNNLTVATMPSQCSIYFNNFKRMTGQFGNQRTVNVAGARKTVGGQEVPTADSSTDSEPLEQVQYNTGYNVFANKIQHSEQSESISNTCVVETGGYVIFIPDSPDMCDNEIQTDHNAVECDDERVALANLIANLKLDIDENKMIQNQLKKANASLT
ncbi:hypothetical protein Tco_0374110 [Tanacetum coccineum]